MTESELRAAIVAEALSWKGTPYRDSGCIKGVGCNCAQLLFGVAVNAKAIPADSPRPRHYSGQLHVHSKEERLEQYFLSYGAVPIAEQDALPGDIVLYRLSAQSYGHGAILIALSPATIVHAIAPRGCIVGGISDGFLAAAPRQFFSLWKGGH